MMMMGGATKGRWRYPAEQQNISNLPSFVSG